MKYILCYGDSNTWGFNPKTKDRFSPEIRWPGVLRKKLGSHYWVIEEGLRGRTTVWDDPIEGEWKNGLYYLTPCLESHAPLDLVIIMLGTNDLKMRFSVSSLDIANGLKRLVTTVLYSQCGPKTLAPKLLLIAPPPIGPLTEFSEAFAGSQEKSYQMGKLFQEIAENYNCHFFDASSIIQSCDEDGIHLSSESHKEFGMAVAEIVLQITM